MRMQPLVFTTPRAGLEPATIRLTAAVESRLTPTRTRLISKTRALFAVSARKRRLGFGVSREEFSDRTRTVRRASRLSGSNAESEDSSPSSATATTKGSGLVVPGRYEIQSSPYPQACRGRGRSRRVGEFNSSVIDEFRANSGVVGGPFEDSAVMLLTMTGAKSGQRRLTPLEYFQVDGRVISWAHAVVPKPTLHGCTTCARTRTSTSRSAQSLTTS